MSLFRRWTGPRRRDQRTSGAIAEFWSWWSAQGAAETAAAIAEGDPARVGEALTPRVHALDPGLVWALAPGTDSTHALIVSCGGDPALRAFARRWRLSAPAASDVWEYSDSRRAAPDPQTEVLTLNGIEIDLATAMVHAQVTGASVDVGVYHRVFASMPEQARMVATYLMLDAVLGESAVETWLGTVTSMTTPALDPVPLTGLPTVIEHLEAKFTDAQGLPAWILLNGETSDGATVLVSTQVPLRPATAPHLDTYVAVSVPFSDLTPEGLPGPRSLPALRQLEDHLIARLDGSGRLVAHQTATGVRLMHLYVDSTTPAVEQLRAALIGWDQGRIQLAARPDPGWDSVSHLRT